jgi:hypothetical protein
MDNSETMGTLGTKDRDEDEDKQNKKQKQKHNTEK